MSSWENCLWVVTVIPGLTRKSLAELFGYFLSSAHTDWRTFLRPMRLLTHRSGHSKEEGCLNKSGQVWSTMETPKTPANRPTLTCAKGCQELWKCMCCMCTRVCVHAQEAVWSQIFGHIWSLILMCAVVEVVRMWTSAKLGFQTVVLCAWSHIKREKLGGDGETCQSPAVAFGYSTFKTTHLIGIDSWPTISLVSVWHSVWFFCIKLLIYIKG